MARETTDEPQSLVLPVSAASPSDVGRLILELELIDDALLQSGLKGSQAKMPGTSKLMDQAVHVNRLKLLQQPDRVALRQFLENVKRQSPIVHVSFSADPSPDFLEKLVAWLRREIHPSLLLTIGLQPNIGAGCIMRTTNKQFDFSLRQSFVKNRGLLTKQLAKPQPVPAPETMKETAA